MLEKGYSVNSRLIPNLRQVASSARKPSGITSLPMPSPAIAYLTKAFRASAGVVISASHNPYQDNGVKFFSSMGVKLSDETQKAIEKKIDEATGSNSSLKKEKDKLKDLAKDGLKVEESLLDEKRVRDNYNTVTNMLRDTGIKSTIIKKYLPIMNQLINRYLKELDFYVSFELDENFMETIKSRFRDEFSYASFSEGEKMRIDLALLFTWRSVARMKNSVNTNLLILDEVFDSSLDVAGTDEFLKLLNTLTDGVNAFIISHKGDTLYDKFSNVLKFEKYKNFSRLAN